VNFALAVCAVHYFLYATESLRTSTLSNRGSIYLIYTSRPYNSRK